MREVIRPASREDWLKLRSKDITSTEIGALFGISPYVTEFELWHRKKEGLVIELPGNDRMKWGTRLQDSIAEGIAEDNGWKVRKMDEYIRGTTLRIGSSFDFEIEIPQKAKERQLAPGAIEILPQPSLFGVLEIKNVDFFVAKDQWLKDEEGNIEAPLHIEMQLQHQMLVSGYSFGYIAALVGGNDVRLMKRTADPAIQNRIRSASMRFWKSIEDNIPPAPNFERDSAFIAKLYGYAEPNKVYDATGDQEINELLSLYSELSASEKSAEAGKKAIKAKMLIKIGNAEKVIGAGWTISAGTTGPTRVEAYDRAGFRNFRPYFKKEKS